MVDEVEADFAVQPATHEVGSELPQAVMDFPSPPPFPPKQCPGREINVNKSDPWKRLAGESSFDSLAPFLLSKHPYVVEPSNLLYAVPAHPGFGAPAGFARIGRKEDFHSPLLEWRAMTLQADSGGALSGMSALRSRTRNKP